MALHFYSQVTGRLLIEAAAVLGARGAEVGIGPLVRALFTVADLLRLSRSCKHYCLTWDPGFQTQVRQNWFDSGFIPMSIRSFSVTARIWKLGVGLSCALESTLSRYWSSIGSDCRYFL